MKLINRVAGLAVVLGGLGIAPTVNAAPKANITFISVAGLKQEIAKSKGKPVVVNFWATWCPGCLQEMPELAKLRKVNAGKMKLILVAANETGSRNDVSNALLTRGHNSTLLFRSDLPTFFSKFAPSYKGSIALPVTMFFDKNGKLVKAVNEPHAHSQYQKWLNPYLK